MSFAGRLTKYNQKRMGLKLFSQITYTLNYKKIIKNGVCYMEGKL
jgi:hypothetical protein